MKLPFLSKLHLSSINYLSRYEPYEFNEDKIYVSHINTAVFLQSMFQYIWESIVFSRGAPYRRSIFSNCMSRKRNFC